MSTIPNDATGGSRRPAPAPAAPRAVAGDTDQPCDACGRYGAHAIAGRHLCEACIVAAGSCCTEFEKPVERETEP